VRPPDMDSGGRFLLLLLTGAGLQPVGSGQPPGSR